MRIRNLFITLILCFSFVSNCYAIGINDLAKDVSNSTGLPEVETKKQVEAVFDRIEDALKNGEDVTIRNFGKFYSKKMAARKGRNPRTGEVIQIEAKSYPRFRASENLKKNINSKAIDTAQLEK